MSTTATVKASPDWIARSLAQIIRAAKSLEDYESAIAMLRGYLERLAEAQAATTPNPLPCQAVVDYIRGFDLAYMANHFRFGGNLSAAQFIQGLHGLMKQLPSATDADKFVQRIADAQLGQKVDVQG